jgi:TolB-like protein
MAVLPFVNSSGVPDTEYLADGITGAVDRNGLSQVPGLQGAPSLAFRA